ncbi:hypothetical protein DPMN_100577 [Dreissena polymorpha]|uniref:Uncharacterized protein n=1 Tax=Dreissena polymorpha TaxID=45954 RepID=A0A9D4LHJ8_DREPO|nr:hypothetical protein DPMN_100577 [Dreissena polymorpha]
MWTSQLPKLTEPWDLFDVTLATAAKKSRALPTQLWSDQHLSIHPQYGIPNSSKDPDTQTLTGPTQSCETCEFCLH